MFNPPSKSRHEPAEPAPPPIPASLSFEVREINPADLNCVRATFDSNADVFNQDEINKAKREAVDFAYRDRNYLGEAFVALDSDAIGYFGYWEDFEAPEAWIGWLCVEKNHQRRGAGTCMLEKVKCRMQKRGIESLFVQTSSTPQFFSARSFYESRGFELLNVQKDAYGPGDDMLTYRIAVQKHV